METDKNFFEREQLAKDELSKLAILHKRATTVLLKCSTVFPFDLFPNTLIIDHNKVDIIYRHFFSNSETISLPISRISYVSVDSVLFLSTLRITVRELEKNPPPLLFMSSRDAHLAKNLIFGLMSAYQHDIDLTHLPKDVIMDKLIQIGQSV